MKRAERATLRRREILAAYYDNLVEEGLQATSIARIARRLDVTPSLLIHYFGTKEQMTIELVDYLLDEFLQAYGNKLAAIPQPLERLRAILATFFSPEYHRLLDDSAFYACFYLSLRHEKLRRRFVVLREAELALIEQTIAACMAAGHIPCGDAHALALAVNALEEGYAFLIGGDPDEAAKTETGLVLKAQAFALLGMSGE